MIYVILKFLSQLTVWGYFRKVKVVGKENIPEKGPYLFVANHPSAFMDPMVVATSIQQQVYFIAAGEYVGKGVKGWIFQKLLHMIPVYRPTTRPGETHKNEDMFLKCYEHMSNEGAILIFPEGVSTTEKKLKPLKTGTVRIALGAEQRNDYQLNVAIVPVGLNYSDPHEFRSDLFVKIGKPLYVNEHLTPQIKASKEAQITLTKELTEQLHAEMEKTVLHLESEEKEEAFDKLERIFSRDIKNRGNIGFDDQEKEFDIHKDFIAGINYFKKTEPLVFEETEQKVDTYLAKLNNAGLSDKDIGEFAYRYTSRRTLSYILGLPFFILGVINNYLPYRLVGFVRSKIKLDVTFEGSISLALGLFIFLIWYIGVAILIGTLWLGWLALFYPILMYATGLYALIYQTAVRQSKQRNTLRKMAVSKQESLKDLIQKRKEIILILENCITVYAQVEQKD